MQLSENAQSYLSRLQRDKEYVCTDPLSVSQYMQRQEIKTYSKIIDFQVLYSGLILSVLSKKSTFSLQLFAKEDIASNRPIDFMKIDGRCYFDFGEHSSAPFWFVIADTGEIATYDHIDCTVNVISSGVESLIEQYAMEDKLALEQWHEYPAYLQLLDKVQFAKRYSGSENFTFAWDRFNQWYQDQEIVIHIGTWLDRQEQYVHLYGRREEDCNAFIERLKNLNIVA